MTSQLIDNYLRERRANNLITSDNTVRSYRAKLMAWLKFGGGKITPQLAIEYRDHLIAAYDSTQVKQHLHVLSCFYEATYDGPNPFSSLAQKYRRNKSEIEAARIVRDEKVMTDDEIRAMLLYARNLCNDLEGIDYYLACRNWFMIRMLSEFGIRIDALVNLNMSEISMQERRLTVWASKNKKPYPLPLIPVLNDLKAYLVARDRFMTAISGAQNSQNVSRETKDALFLSKTGRRLSDTSARRAINSVAKALNLHEPGRSSHQIRHYRATKYHKMGMRHELISAIMGMSVRTLRTTYLHLTHGDIVADYEAWMQESEKNWVCPRCGYGADEKHQDIKRLKVIK